MLRHTDLNICHYSGLWHILLQRSPVSNAFCLQFESLCNANQGSLSGSSGMPDMQRSSAQIKIGAENHGQKTEKNIPNHLRAPLIGALGAHEGLAHPGGDINPLQFVAVNLDMASGPPGNEKKKQILFWCDLSSFVDLLEPKTSCKYAFVFWSLIYERWMASRLRC